MTTARLMSTYLNPMARLRSRQMSRSTAGLAELVASSQIACVRRLSYSVRRSCSDIGTLSGVTPAATLDALDVTAPVPSWVGRGGCCFRGVEVEVLPWPSAAVVPPTSGGMGVASLPTVLRRFGLRELLGRLLVILALVAVMNLEFATLRIGVGSARKSRWE